MQENEFEKQVKEMMEGFKPTPPDAAWDNISRKLEKERPRKLPFIFLLGIGLIIAAGIVFYFTKEKRQGTVIAAKSNHHTAITDSNTVKGLNENAFVQKYVDAKNNTPLPQGSKTSNAQPAGPVNSEMAPLKLSATSISGNSHLPADKNTVIEQRNDLPQSIVIPLNENKINRNDAPVKNNVTETSDTINQVKNIANDNNAVVNNNSTPGPALTVQNENETAKQAKKTVTTKNFLPEWQWGVNASYGESNAVKSITNASKSQQQYLSFPSSISNGGRVVYHNDYVYKPSDTYGFGFDVQKKILKNAVLGSGIGFTHISTKSDVSRKVDSAYSLRSSSNFSGGLINGYFPPGVSEVYTHTYNFIELPLYFQQYFLQRNKFSLSYNAGFSVRQLLSSKSLIYNEEDNIYFSKNDMLRKTQLQFLAGLNFKFNTGKTTSVYVGPQFSYSLSSMLKNDTYGNFHFMTYGIKAGLLLHKK